MSSIPHNNKRDVGTEFADGLLDLFELIELGREQQYREPSRLVFQASLDDSSRDGMYSLAGWVANVFQWRSFLVKFKKEILDKYEIPVVKSADLYSRKGRIYKDRWPDDTIPLEIFEAVLRLANEHAFAATAVSVDLRYLQSLPEKDRKRIGNPDELCFRRTMKMVLDAVRKIDYNDQFAITCDDNENVSMRLYGLLRSIKRQNGFWKHHIGGICFVEDEYYTPIQAADVLAFVTARSRDPKFEALLQTGLKGQILASEHWDKEPIDDLVENLRRDPNWYKQLDFLPETSDYLG